MLVGVLGPTQVRTAAGETVLPGGTGVRALLGMLVVDAGRVVGVDRLIDGLYGGTPPNGAANALQSQVSRLRRALRDLGWDTGTVEFHPAGYRLAVDPDDTDLHRFERLAADARRALATNAYADADTHASAALALWRGAPFADMGGAPFAAGQAARLAEVRLAVIEDRAEARLAAGRHDHNSHHDLTAELAPLVAEHPLRERLRGQLMRALAGSGRSAEALASFEEARQLLADQLGTSPSDQLSAVHVAVLRGAPDGAPATPGGPDPLLVAQPPRRAAPPAQLTSFVGREEELARVAGRLADARLVTLTGPGGAGKTRLAVEVALRDSGEVCFVELAPLADGADVPRAVLAALGLREAGMIAGPDRGAPARTEATERIAAALAGRDLLLVVDNCEHVIDDIARLLARLLGACPQLRVLATSREALGITGELLSPVPTLPVPPADTAPSDTAPGPSEMTATDAARYPAVRLFADRAAAVRPGFRLDAETTGPVLQICRALDGLPLAIELAAARLRALPVTEVAARLSDRFQLLSRGSRTAVRRHRTLRAVVEWSWDLLDEPERVLARRLTVFVGGATLAAAEQVCGLPPADVVDLLTSLADKSLIEAVDGGHRYRMLDTVRAFGAERLAEAGEADRFRAAHAAYYLAFAEGAEPHLMRAEQLQWLRRLDDEYENLHGALRQAIRDHDQPLALRLMAALTPYWWLRGIRGVGSALALDLIPDLGTEPPPDLGEEYALCVLHAAGGPPLRDLRVHLKNVDTLMTGLTTMPKQHFLNVMWAVISGPPASEQEYLMSVGRWEMPLTDPWLVALRQFGIGYVLWYSGDKIGAETEFVAAVAGLRVIGERWGLATALSALADLADSQGDLARATALTDEALSKAAELEAPAEVAEMLCRRGDRNVGIGALDAARADYVRAAEMARRSGAAEPVAASHLGLAALARLEGDLDRARGLLDIALAHCPSDGFGPAATRTGILVELGRLAEAGGDPAAAETWYRRGLETSLRQPNDYTAAEAVRGLAELALRRDQPESAATLLGAADRLNNGLGPERPAVGALVAAVEKAAGSAFTAAFARGRGMHRDLVLSYVAGR